jgi:flagellar hook-length control protein FliK
MLLPQPHSATPRATSLTRPEPEPPSRPPARGFALDTADPLQIAPGTPALRPTRVAPTRATPDPDFASDPAVAAPAPPPTAPDSELAGDLLVAPQEAVIVPEPAAPSPTTPTPDQAPIGTIAPASPTLTAPPGPAAIAATNPQTLRPPTAPPIQPSADTPPGASSEAAPPHPAQPPAPPQIQPSAPPEAIPDLAIREAARPTWHLTPPPRPATTVVPQPQAVAGQVAVAIEQASGRRVEIRLDPPELGRVQIELRPVDGGLQAVVLAQRPETHELLRRHADLLIRDLVDAGFGAVTLDFANGGEAPPQDRPRADWQGVAATQMPPEPPVRRPRPAASDGLDIRL